MKAIILTILVLGLCGAVRAGSTYVTDITEDDLADSLIYRDTAWFYSDGWCHRHPYLRLHPALEELCPCCTVFVVDTVWLPSDSLFKMKWYKRDLLFDGVFKEIK